jgi:hypothetical protein
LAAGRAIVDIVQSPASSAWRPRKARLIGIHTLCSTGRWMSPSASSLDGGAAYVPASPRADSNDWTYPPLVIVVVLTMSMLGTRNV